MSESKRPVVLDSKKSASSRISETVRYVSFGLLAAAFAFLTSDNKFSESFVRINREFIILTALFAILALVADISQYVAQYVNADESLHAQEGHRGFLKKSLARTIQQRAFVTKIIFFSTACVLLIIGFFRSLFDF